MLPIVALVRDSREPVWICCRNERMALRLELWQSAHRENVWAQVLAHLTSLAQLTVNISLAFIFLIMFKTHQLPNSIIF